MKTIEEQIFDQVQNIPDKVALISGDTEITYSQLWDYCLCAAEKLKQDYHLKKGDRVILSAAGNIEFVYAYFGVHIAGGICVPIDPDTNQTRFEYIEKSTTPVCVMGLLHNVKKETIPFSDVVNGTSKATYIAPEQSQVADILFTTGTTGAPKGVALSYNNLSAAARNINAFIGNTSSDVELLALPVSHSFGLGRLRCSLSKGATVVMLGTFANVKKFFKEMTRCQVTMFAMVPASWGFIKKMSGKYIGKFADQLKFIEIGSSFMPVEDKELLMSLLPKTRICMHYGSTEASRSAFMEFHTYKDNLLSIGKASPNVEIKIFTSQGTPAALGEEGEVCVKGEHVTCSYWNETPERFASDFYDGYFRTGDCGTMDAEGNIYLKSRIKEMINVGGKKVSPMEVEDILNTIPGIKESACIGIPDPGIVLGEVVKAFIVADDNLSDEEIMQQLRPQLEVYKLPVEIERINPFQKQAQARYNA
ncbi:acyl--CoA ligase [Prevotella copri]|jgi:long-chain acyl-CoA synthetase|uniref:Acyl--CoA ligase n=1 Tax=Segatella copri TaxID=165179 RepID=A0AAW5ITE6_9BACT|nr:class I adenylate-forming enzyme family protein [Segatella copri]MCP9553379.1 acyl--CoA ligase [Segatella copri]MCP9574553.1 acyl--CoA ligase [Segatella copri]MCP9577143.1 acyl--CoA ligase [Segatella copri]MCP9580140.1 acyl--CoA ligase [Segatella copri]MCP9582983.1 acyl--CoA ligase [Segatella copri]